MLPNIIAQMIPLCRKKYSASPYTFFCCCCINVGCGLLVSLHKMFYDETFGLQISSYVLLGFGFFFLIFPFDTCCCKTWFDGPHFAIGEICHRKLSRQDFINAMSSNRALPPSIVVTAEAWYEETRTREVAETDADGDTWYRTETYTETVTTWVGSADFEYLSWQEDSNSIRIKNTDIIHAVCKVRYNLDEGAQKELDKLVVAMDEIASHHDVHHSAGYKQSCPGIRYSVTGFYSHEEPGAITFYQSWYGRLFWSICFILGYQSAYETYWCSSGERMRLNLVKSISCQSGKYRCTYNTEDVVAAETTFRTDEIASTLNSPLLTSCDILPPTYRPMENNNPSNQPTQQYANPYSN